mgnify:CR=1 FL=1
MDTKFCATKPEELEKHLSDHTYFSGKSLPGPEDASLLAVIKTAPCAKTTPLLFAWWWNLRSFSESARASWTNDCKKTDECKKEDAKPAADDEDDLFGELTADQQAAIDIAKKKADEKKAAEKKEKKVIIQKSNIIFEVKGYEVGQDFNKLAHKIFDTFTNDGLLWQKKYEILDEAFGMQKLKMAMCVEDDKINTDDIFEKIQSWEEVQSTDILDFSKA